MRLDPITALKGLFNVREKHDPEAVKPFLDHLEDLRWMVIKVAVTIMAGMMASFGFRKSLMGVLTQPLGQFTEAQRQLLLQTRRPAEGFMIAMQLAFYCGMVLTLPVLMYFVAQFVVPALTKREKKYVIPAICVGFVLFAVGAAFCFKFVLPRALGFFFGFNTDMGFSNLWTAADYFSFVTRMEVAFGLAFEMPALVLLLVFFGALSFEFLRRTRAYAIVLVLVLAMLIAPTPDPATFLALGVPMCLLYEACIWGAWLIEWRKRKREQQSTDSAEL
jgi:sec-independent protein translocase protein TatC